MLKSLIYQTVRWDNKNKDLHLLKSLSFVADIELLRIIHFLTLLHFQMQQFIDNITTRAQRLTYIQQLADAISISNALTADSLRLRLAETSEASRVWDKSTREKTSKRPETYLAATRR